jgi:hypothetical protein
LEEHRQKVQSYKERDSQTIEAMYQSAVDKLSQENICGEKNVENLKQVTIKDLKAGEIE